MKSKASIYNNILLVIGTIILVILMHTFGFSNIAKNIITVGPWFGLLIMIWGIVYLLNTLAFHTIVQDKSPEAKNVSFARMFQITLTGFAINGSNPIGMAGGEPYRIFQLKPLIGGPKASSSVILYNMIHYTSHFALWIMTIPLIILTLKLRSGLIIGLWIGFAALLLLSFLFFKGYKKGMAYKTISLLCKVPFIRNRMQHIMHKYSDQLITVDENISNLWLARRGDFFRSLIYDLASRIVSCFEINVILYAMGSPVTFGDAVIIYSLSTLIANILFFSPMQLGTREGGYILAATAVGLPISSLGISISLISRVREFIWIGIGLAIIKVKPRKKKQYDRHS